MHPTVHQASGNGIQSNDAVSEDGLCVGGGGGGGEGLLKF